MSDNDSPDERPRATGGREISRRSILGGMGGAALLLVSCRADQRVSTPPVPLGSPEILPDDAVPPGTPRDALRFFNPQQARTVDAVVARLIPGTAENPGAREAGVVFYIDHLLGNHTGHPKPVYTEGPYARVYFGDAPPQEDDDSIWVSGEEIGRYGWQAAFLPREVYRMGLARLDALADARFGAAFADLTEDRQDELLAAVEDDAEDVREVFRELLPSHFFTMVRTHTVQGFFADPVYGGNRDAVGWRLVGFPGSRRSYAPREMFDEGYDAEPQSLLDLPPFNVDRPHDHGPGHEDVPTAVRKRHPNGPVD